MSHAIEILQRTPAVLKDLLWDISPEWAGADEGPETWNPYYVIGHLIHGEKTDWPERLRKILDESEDKHFRPFDRFAQFEESKGKSLNMLLNDFEQLRLNNLKLLEKWNISGEDLQLTGIHPTFGTVTLSQLMSAWVVHDLDHIFQISRVMAKQYREAAGPWIQYLRIIRD